MNKKMLILLTLLIGISHAIIIEIKTPSFIKNILNIRDKITAQNQSKDTLYAEQFNDKFQAVVDRMVIEFGFAPYQDSFDQPILAGEVIRAETFNTKFNDLVASMLEIDAGLEVPPILLEQFTNGEKIDVVQINQKFIALDNLIDNVVALPDKIVLNGETWSVAAGTIHSYANININAGGIVDIVGAGVTVLEAKKDFINNGTIKGQSNSVNQSIQFLDNTYVDDKPQQAAGISAGNPNGADGSHGASLVIKARNLIGSGTIDIRGTAGGTGSPSPSGRQCPSGFTLRNPGQEVLDGNVEHPCANNNTIGSGLSPLPNYNLNYTANTGYTCLLNGKSFGNSYTNGSNFCLIANNSFVLDVFYINDNATNRAAYSTICQTLMLAENSLKSNVAYAGGTYQSQACPVSWFRKPVWSPGNTRGGGGAGGNGGNLWLVIQENNSALNLLTDGGAGGQLSTTGTGGTAGSPGLVGIISTSSY